MRIHSGMMPHARHTAARMCAALVGVLTLAILPTSCGSKAPEQHPLRVVVSIAPLAGLVAPILPEGSSIRVLVPANRTAHGYAPKPQDLAEIARADLVVLVGLGLDSRIESTARRSGAAVVSMADVLGIRGENHDTPHHDHDDHQHGGADPHLWLDPVLAARFIRDLPAHLPEPIRAHLHALDLTVDRINAVDEAYRERLAPFAGRAIVAHHNSMSRLAERYGLRVAGVLRSSELLEPSPEDVAKIRRVIEKEGIGAIFVEPQFGGGIPQRIADSLGVRLVVFDPLGNGNWFTLMQSNLDHLVEGLELGDPEP